MKRKNFLMLATALVLGAGAMGMTGVALAQPGPRGQGGGAIYDPAPLPQLKGKVAQYALTPRGDVVGLILDDGTEVHVPPFVSTQLVFAVKPGDAVTIHGMKAKTAAMMVARSVTNDATGATVLVTMPNRRGDDDGATLEAAGKVAAVLHSPRGEVSGVRLEDGTQVRLPPNEAKRLGEMLMPGKMVVVRGEGYAGPLGRVIAARQLGADKDSLKDIAGPRHGERRFGPGGGHGPRHGWMHDDDDNSDGHPMRGKMRGPMHERG